MNAGNEGGQYGRRHPAGAYPTIVFSAQEHVFPERIRVESTPDAHFMWIDGASISVPRDGDDTQLQAALDVAFLIARTAERFGSLVRAEQEHRERQRAEEQVAAAHRAAEQHHQEQTYAAPAEQQQPERTHPYEATAEPHPGDAVVHPITPA